MRLTFLLKKKSKQKKTVQNDDLIGRGGACSSRSFKKVSKRKLYKNIRLCRRTCGTAFFVFLRVVVGADPYHHVGRVAECVTQPFLFFYGTPRTSSPTIMYVRSHIVSTSFQHRRGRRCFRRKLAGLPCPTAPRPYRRLYRRKQNKGSPLGGAIARRVRGLMPPTESQLAIKFVRAYGRGRLFPDATPALGKYRSPRRSPFGSCFDRSA